MDMDNYDRKSRNVDNTVKWTSYSHYGQSPPLDTPDGGFSNTGETNMERDEGAEIQAQFASLDCKCLLRG